MSNKILIQLIVPEIEEKYDIFIPINRRIGNIINLFDKVIYELNTGKYNMHKRNLYNHETGIKYYVNDLVRDTDIRNGSILVLI